jgi:hypothetical protein
MTSHPSLEVSYGGVVYEYSSTPVQVTGVSLFGSTRTWYWSTAVSYLQIFDRTGTQQCSSSTRENALPSEVTHVYSGVLLLSTPSSI